MIDTDGFTPVSVGWEVDEWTGRVETWAGVRRP